MTFGEAYAVLVAQQFAVVVGRCGDVECALKQNLARGGFEKIGPADDLGNLHVGIIDDDGELVRGDIIATPDDEVAEVAAGNVFLRALPQIGEAHRVAVGHTETPVHAGGQIVVAGLIEAAAACAGVERFVIGVVRGRDGLGEVATRTGTGIDEAAVAEGAPCGEVLATAFALQVGRVRSTNIGTFGPADAEPAQFFEHGDGEVGARALGIEVFVAEDESAIAGDGPLICRPEGAGVTKVQKAGWRRRKASAVGAREGLSFGFVGHKETL